MLRLTSAADDQPVEIDFEAVREHSASSELEGAGHDDGNIRAYWLAFSAAALQNLIED